MRFENRLKGDLAQSIVRSLLIQARYRVVEFGVEKTVRELSSLSLKAFDSMRKTNHEGVGTKVGDEHRVLSAMPDLIVMDSGQTRLSLLEVKYRGTLDDARAAGEGGLLMNLRMQAHRFREVVVVLLIGDLAKADEDGPEDMSAFLRCFVLKATTDTAGDGLMILTERGVLEFCSLGDSITAIWEAAMPLQAVFGGLDAGLGEKGRRSRSTLVAHAVRGLKAIDATAAQTPAIAASKAA